MILEGEKPMLLPFVFFGLRIPLPDDRLTNNPSPDLTVSDFLFTFTSRSKLYETDCL